MALIVAGFVVIGSSVTSREVTAKALSLVNATREAPFERETYAFTVALV